MADQLEALIQEIAVKHGIAVGRDDPIMVLHTINQRLLLDSAKSQETQLDSFREELEAIAHRWGSDSKEKAERILNAALSASKETMANAMKEGSKEAAAAVRKQMDESMGRVEGIVRDAQRVALFNVAAGVLALAAAAIALFAGFR